jgi:hypothetical protein
MRHLLCLLSGSAFLIAAPASAALPHEGHRHTIEGRLEPELLPETSVWDNVFAALHSLTGRKTDPRDPEVQSFVKGNLFISDADAAILLQEVAATRARVRRLEVLPNDEFTVDGRADDGSERRKQINEATLEARDRILQRLSPRGSKALLRWVAIVKQGMSHGPNR